MSADAKPEFVWVIDTGIGLSAPRVRKFRFRRWPDGEKGGAVVLNRGRISHIPQVAGRFFEYAEAAALRTWKARAVEALDKLAANIDQINRGWQVEHVPEGG